MTSVALSFVFNQDAFRQDAFRIVRLSSREGAIPIMREKASRKSLLGSTLVESRVSIFGGR
jgi:hypothetical protein